MKKKIAAVLLAASMTGVMLAGCSNGSASASGTDGQGNVKYVVMKNQAIAEYPPDGGEAKKVIQAAWEKDLGITNTDYEVILASGTDYDTKLNAMMSGDEVPDLFTVKVTDLQNLVDNGIIAPVDDLVAKMPSYQALLEDPANKARYDNFMIDGKHYGLPDLVLPGTLNGPGVDGMIVRTDWLENIGADTPKTLDELHDVLYSFTFEDPDGNGQDDTYGLGGNKGQYFSSIFGAYGIYMKDINSWMEVDGKLVNSTTLPETKEVLKLLNQWYTEGLIDPDKFVVEGKQAKDKFIAGKFGAWENTVWWANDARIAWEASGSAADCAFITPVSGPEGEHGFPVTMVTGSAAVISQNCVDTKDIDRFAKILNWTCDDSETGGLKLVEYGEEGKHYTYDAATDSIDNTIAGDTVNMYALGYSNPVRWLNVVDRRWIQKEDPRELDLRVSNDSENWLSTEFAGSVPAMKEYPDLFTKLWDEYFTKIVTGALPVDAFDEYVDAFYAQGGTELTEQVNEAWSAAQ